MHILFVTYEYPPRIEGGAGVYAKYLTRELAKLDHNITILTPMSNSDNFPRTPDPISVIPIPISEKLPFRAPQYWLKIPHYIRNYSDEADIIHYNGLSYLWHINRPVDLPQVTTIHHPVKESPYESNREILDALNGEYNFVTRFMERRAINCSDHIISVSNYTQNGLINAYGQSSKDISTIYHGVNHLGILGDTISKEPTNSPSILFVGRINDKRKGLDLLLKAVSKLEKEYELNIVGKGDTQKVKEACKELGIASNTHLRGFVTESELVEWYSKSDVYVAPSREEGFGFTCFESLLLGCPVVISDVGAIPEVTNNFSGVQIVPKESIDMITQSIKDICSKRVVINPESIISQYNWRDAAIETLKIYDAETSRHNKEN